MDKVPKLWTNPAEAVFFTAGVLLLIGTVNIFSASFVLGGQLFHDSYFFIKRHIASSAVGFIIMIIVAKMDYRRFRGEWLILLTLTVICLLVAVHYGGVDANGARRWLKLGTIQFQPSEIAKLAIIMLSAAYLGPKIDRQRPVTLFSWPVAAALVIGGLVLRQPDMGTAAVIVGLSLFLFLMAGIPRREITILFAGGAAMAVFFIQAAAYRAERIAAWFDPWSYQQTTGYQTVQSLLAIGSGGPFGMGLGMGASKFHYLPEAHTDFAFAVLCQEMGFVGALLVLGVLAVFGWYAVKIACRAVDGYGLTLALGITALIVGQAAGNIAMVVGLLPVTGVPLPFISFGGTSLLVNMVALGLLISIGRQASGKTDPDSGRRERLQRSRRRPVNSSGPTSA
ncbi:MAG TPA: putative peptidoglycan glycosyltransferase FtsW [Methylomusa anaerophila]|uniref:Probable peptidoglycan glycosyltransferase FtsW n=1 Tax=Methylomusa anaerophila TaxID=1930071 RepID=A0A348AI01_9FIRM|nr:putative peptidoglycan glycosyltransferase FtsW [Methylomusa anaerophila]BBB90699.1 lipid II flippase FtsW [Methylomusa anaerophila]HML88698.1 putative peptidoglycan glycosyltransferase FtsW [Methylomusa anaerophila]